MLRQLFKNKKAQNTAEYALLIALVVAGIIAMQTYAQRALQARVRDASSYMTGSGGSGTEIGSTAQYEPYYMQSHFNVESSDASVKKLAEGTVAYDEASNRTKGGGESSTYDNKTTGLKGGV